MYQSDSVHNSNILDKVTVKELDILTNYKYTAVQ